ncbi:23S rRNA (adenine(2030)-N(6))-methyltransferase RlmJ [Aureibacillus halotolerans]|uniref:23S rRNA A2030 N6-methylase RlmJ n=1 Tax=Aureibacillus halotolerans TaxID=1508390 RepID=A0A4R6TW54_9BACI|nr:23S rRNA (adenine(2030)-N(6))-methyltransferase RlmJ [Aureibacillus halotolerans]TDQ37671.1 23S rRNA A2030 N6-methylase RlmJ [Aureibacillus halotolerans]
MAAGNFGDVVKHMVLLELVSLMVKDPQRKTSHFKYFETHGSEIEHAKLLSKSLGAIKLNELYNNQNGKFLIFGYQNDYLRLMKSYFGSLPITYPGSWYQVYRLLNDLNTNISINVCENDKIVSVPTLKEINDRNINVDYHDSDGLEKLKDHIKTKDLDLVFVDPYYTAEKTDKNLVFQITNLLDTNNIPYVIWFPRYTRKFRFCFIEDLKPELKCNMIEVTNKPPNKSSRNMLSSCMLFSANLVKYIEPIKKNISFLGCLGLGWEVKK